MNIIDKNLENIFNFYSNLEDYELEVALTDIFLIYNSEIKKDFRVSKIYITQPVRDNQIDSIIVSDDNTLYTYQISKSKKYRSQLTNFLKDSTVDKYLNILDVPQSFKPINRIVCTLEKSPSINTVDVISHIDLLKIISTVWNHIGLNDANKQLYKENIQIRSAFWERINVLRRKNKITYVNAYLDVMLSNHYSLINGAFNLLSSLEAIETFNFDSLLTLSTNLNNDEKIKKMLLFKSSIVYDGDFHKIYDDCNDLIDYLLKLINYNFKDYFIVPRSKYISIKNKTSSKVIAYFPYKYNDKNAPSYNGFGFKCDSNAIPLNLISNNKIQVVSNDIINININNQIRSIKHGCSFKTEIYFTQPDLSSSNDKEVLSELFTLSKH